VIATAALLEQAAHFCLRLTSSLRLAREETGSEGVACSSAIRNLCTIRHGKDITKCST
jgi:hypothetical protein